MKKNSGSALTSVIVVFLLVTMIGMPLIGMVVYNYRLREFDSGIKESEYNNEIVMDIISTIIKNEVIMAISEAKETSTTNIKLITDTLLNSYSAAYNDAADAANAVASANRQYDADGNLIVNADTEKLISDTLKNTLESNLASQVGDLDIYSGLESDDLVGILGLDFSEDLSVAKINDENLQAVCNSIFQERYQEILLDETDGLFVQIYNDDKYKELTKKLSYGDSGSFKDFSPLKDNASLSLNIKSKFKYLGKNRGFEHVYEEGMVHDTEFDGNIYRIGVETNCKLNDRTPTTKLSATFVIGTPEFNSISSIEQQTIPLSNATLDYGLIVGETLKLGAIDGAGNVTSKTETIIDGNILLKANGVTETSNNGMFINSGSKLKLEKGLDVASEGRIATPGDIIMDNDTELVTGSNPIYYRNLYVGDPNNQKNTESIVVKFNGDVMAKDDLEINLNSNVKIEQVLGKTYFGFNDLNDAGPDSSSAIVVNSSVDALDYINITLGKLCLAGRAFIEDVRSKSKDDIASPVDKPLIYKTGESISIKGNYVAYQTPLEGTTDNKYDYNKVDFSSYFLSGEKTGIDGITNLEIKLVDSFKEEESNKNYKTFDVDNKWEYFREYATTDGQTLSPFVNKPNITVDFVEHICGVGINGNKLISRKKGTAEYTIEEKRDLFEKYTSYFGYYPEDDSLKKNNIKQWVEFGSTNKKIRDGSLFIYISKENAGTKVLSWGESLTESGLDDANKIHIVPDFDPGETDKKVNGLIIHDGDLIIRNCDDIPFYGTIIVTGNLIIEDDVKIISDKETVSNVIIANYLGEGYTYESGDGNFSSLGTGDLLGSFAYDGSGTTYEVVNVAERSNMIDINDYVGITDWKKKDFGRI